MARSTPCLVKFDITTIPFFDTTDTLRALSVYLNAPSLPNVPPFGVLATTLAATLFFLTIF